jgi:hypothetical protein
MITHNHDRSAIHAISFPAHRITHWLTLNVSGSMWKFGSRDLFGEIFLRFLPRKSSDAQLTLFFNSPHLPLARATLYSTPSQL